MLERDDFMEKLLLGRLKASLLICPILKVVLTVPTAAFSFHVTQTPTLRSCRVPCLEEPQLCLFTLYLPRNLFCLLRLLASVARVPGCVVYRQVKDETRVSPLSTHTLASALAAWGGDRVEQRTVAFLNASPLLTRPLRRSPRTSIVVDLAAMLFTPGTPQVFCGLEHVTHPSIGIVVTR